MNTILVQILPGATAYIGGDTFETGDLDGDVADVAAAAEPVSGDVNPITSEQRRAMFALFNKTFGYTGIENRHDRHLFTTAVLGEGVNPSWAAGGDLTYNQAARLLSVLTVVNALV